MTTTNAANDADTPGLTAVVTGASSGMGRATAARLVADGWRVLATEEFSLVRLGDQSAADAVYDGVEQPLTAEDCADVISYALNAPHHVNLDLVTIRPLAQAAAHRVARHQGV